MNIICDQIFQSSTAEVMKREIREIIIGGATITVLVGALFIINVRDSIIGVAGSQDLTVTAKFNKVDGLSKDSEVRLGGIKIGHVFRMALDDQFRAVITLRLDKSVSIPKDSSASIQTDGLFGAKFVVLEPGAETVDLKPHDQLIFTQDAVIVTDLLELIISEGRIARGQHARSPK